MGEKLTAALSAGGVFLIGVVLTVLGLPLGIAIVAGLFGIDLEPTRTFVAGVFAVGAVGTLVATYAVWVRARAAAEASVEL